MCLESVKLGSEGAHIWDVPDVPAFSSNTRFVALSAGQAERSRSFVLIYDLYHADLHWFMRIGDESCRKIVFNDELLVFQGGNRRGLMAIDICSGALSCFNSSDAPIELASLDFDLEPRPWEKKERCTLLLEKWIEEGVVASTTDIEFAVESPDGNALALVSKQSISFYAREAFEIGSPRFLVEHSEPPPIFLDTNLGLNRV
jgi:hypothetical protein